jgi:hypothetical protein
VVRVIFKDRALFSQNEVPATPLSHSPHSHFTPLSSLGSPLNQPGSRAAAHGKCFKPLCVIATSRVCRKRSVCARRQTSMPPHPLPRQRGLPPPARTHHSANPSRYRPANFTTSDTRIL